MLCVFDSFSQPYITSYTKFEICVTAETSKTRRTFKETSHQNNHETFQIMGSCTLFQSDPPICFECIIAHD